VSKSRAQKVTNIVALQECGNDGVELLADYWRQPGNDNEVVATLASVSSRLNDRRLYDPARAVLLNTSQPEATRLSALSVLVVGYDPSLAITFPTPTVPMRSTYVALGYTSHSNQQQGSRPVKGYAKNDLPGVLKGLAASEQNERVRKVAQELGPLLVTRDSLRAQGAR
jgi:hypothetical protein